MIKLPTQFDARARQHIETAAAGGSTSTCCSSCVVTLGSAVVASSMYFAHLRKRAQAAGEGAPAATPEAPPPEGVGASAHAVQEGPAADHKALTNSTWFWVILVVLMLVLSPALGGEGVALAILVAMALAGWGWFSAHRRAGVGMGQTIIVGVIALVVTLGAIVVEAIAWMEAL